MNFHWAIYGQHKEGHAILAQSGIGKIAERLARFTDRPGDPPAGAQWTSATSGFVFESHFVLLRTIPDNSGRPGMVQSFVVFVPVERLNEVNSLSVLLALLPNTVISIPAKIKPLEYPKAENIPQMNETLGLDFILERLANDTTDFPLVWGMPNDYVPTIDTIWGRIPGRLREKFAFTFHFEPGNKFPVQPQIVATLPSLTSRWPVQQIIPQSGHSVELSDGIGKWFLDVGSSESYRHLVNDYGLNLRSFQSMSHLAKLSALLAKGVDLDFSDSLRAIRILSTFEVIEVEAKREKRVMLFERLTTLIPTASPGDILKLRNLPEVSLPEFIPLAQSALSLWIYQAFSFDTKAKIQIIEEAVGDLEGWWSVPFVNWLKKIASHPSGDNAQILSACILNSAMLATYIGDQLPNTTKWETAFLENVSGSAGCQNLVNIARDRKWIRLHASILADSDDRYHALAEHTQIVTASFNGYEVFLRKWGYPEFLRIADAVGDVQAVGFIAKLLPSYCNEIKQSVLNNMKNGAIFWQNALPAKELDQAVAGLAIEFVNRSNDHDVAGQLLDLSPSLIFALKNPQVILDNLDSQKRLALSQSTTEVVARTLIDGEKIADYEAALFESLIEENLFFQRLDDAPIHKLGTILVESFEKLSFLEDEQFAERLKNLFTRSSQTKISQETTDEISALLLRKAFPKSADVIFDTAEKYFRNDVKPIAMNIAQNYHHDSKSKIAPMVKSKKLIPVLVATALRLERDAVIAHIGDVKYDAKHKFDSGVWPKENPSFEIFVIITGQGNLPTQRLVADISKRIKPEFAFFVGVSGALKDGFFVGDVAYSTKVYYIEGGREDAKGVASRPELESVDENLVQLTHRVAGGFLRKIEEGGASGFDVKDAVIASGAKVLASKSKKAVNYQNVRSHYNDSSIIELEGYGFMVASKSSKIGFAMVIRGVSDGCEGKDPEKDKSDQPLAAQNAASFLFALLKQCPTLLSNKKQKRFLGKLMESLTEFFGG